jgi:hypothetical protein
MTPNGIDTTAHVLFVLDGRSLGDADRKGNLKVGTHLPLDKVSNSARLETSPKLLTTLKPPSINEHSFSTLK